MTDEHDIKALAQMLRGDMDAQVTALGPQVLGTSQPDAHRVNRDDYLAYVRQGWFGGFPGVDPAEFRHNLIMRVGNQTAVQTAQEAWAGHEMEYGQAYTAYQMRMAQQQMQAQQPQIGPPLMQQPMGPPPPQVGPPPNPGPMQPGGQFPAPPSSPGPMMPSSVPQMPSMPVAVPVPMPGQGGPNG